MEVQGISQPLADNYQMVDVGTKTATARRAVAEGKIQMAPQSISRIKNKTIPKGDPMALAEIAGIMAAKKTADLLPLCHPLLLDVVKVQCQIVDDTTIQVICEVSTTAKTGAEMEALMGVQVALLTIYDLTKRIDPELTIRDVFLRAKEGGKSGKWIHPKYKSDSPTKTPKQKYISQSLSGVNASVLTVSDRRSEGKMPDESGALILEFLKRHEANLIEPRIVADEKNLIQHAVRNFCELSVDLILITGGTGVGPRDVTPEAMAEMEMKEIPGFGELLRTSGARSTSLSWLSRSGAGVIDRTLIVFLPGSPKAVKEGLEAIENLLSHTLHILKGGDH